MKATLISLLVSLVVFVGITVYKAGKSIFE